MVGVRAQVYAGLARRLIDLSLQVGAGRGRTQMVHDLGRITEAERDRQLESWSELVEKVTRDTRAFSDETPSCRFLDSLN